MPEKTTRITVCGETWDVPRGFGREYKRLAKADLEWCAKGRPGEAIGLIRDLLGLIGYAASVATVAEWPLRKRVEAAVYASNVHLRASDNPLPRHPKPRWLPAPWCGPTTSRGGASETVFAELATPTEVVNA